MNVNNAATPRPTGAGAGESTVARGVRWTIGAALLALVCLPVYRLLDPQETGLAGRVTLGLLDVYYDFAWSGLLLMLPVGILAAFLISPALFARASARGADLLLRPRTLVFVIGCALLGALFTGAFSLMVLEGKPNMADAFAQVLQARYWAEGMLAGPTDDLAAFWGIQNSIFTKNGWISQYPPGHIALLVPFVRFGVSWLLGPLLVFVTICSAGLIAHRLFAHDVIVGRLAVVLLAFSTFFVLIGASQMNHVTAAAGVTVGGYALIRAWQDDARWAAFAGCAFALALATRPLSTLAMGLAFGILVPVVWPHQRTRLYAVGGWLLLGAAPILVAWFAYNNHFFGSPLRLGYTIALGPSAGLGFHRDPWGNRYGLLEALAYSASDLVTLGVNLFESPLSATLVIGVFLVTVARLPRSAWLLIGWAMAPVLANALYWHHGQYMGPRMLHEAAPAWVLLFALAAVSLVRRVPERAAIADRYFLRPALAAMLLVSSAAGVYLSVQRARSFRGEAASVALTPLPEPGVPAVVFVHDAWTARVAMTLAAEDVRLDRVETLLRQNPTCRVHEMASALAAADTARAGVILGTLDTIPRAHSLPEAVEIAAGDRIRMASDGVLTPDCRRQALSDRFGVIDISPLLWQAELHGALGDGPIIVRDLGPRRNEVVLNAYPGRQPFVYRYDSLSDAARLVEYQDGMQALWSPADTVRLQLRRIRGADRS